MSDDLRAYFEKIESAFCQRRGAPLLLSPLDFEKAVEWFAAGIGAEVVEEGVRDYFAKLDTRKVPLRRAICLSFSEECVLKAREARRAAAVGRAAGVEERRPEAERAAEFLASRADALKVFSESAASRSAVPVLARFAASAAEEIAILARKPFSSLARLENTLGPLDQELGRLVLIESDPALVETWEVAALKRLGDLARNLDEDALRQTVQRLARQSGLAHWGLPRLSLLYME